MIMIVTTLTRIIITMIGKKIYLIGYMGCGKTYTGRRISEKYGLQFIDLDAYIEKRYFKTIPQLFEERGEEGFRQLERTILQEVSSMEDVIISTGGGAACFFDNMDLMNQTGETVYLQASAEALFQYLRMAKKGRPLLANKSDDELLAFIKNTLEKREPFYLKAKHILDSMDESDTLYDQLLSTRPSNSLKRTKPTAVP